MPVCPAARHPPNCRRTHHRRGVLYSVYNGSDSTSIVNLKKIARTSAIILGPASALLAVLLPVLFGSLSPLLGVVRGSGRGRGRGVPALRGKRLASDECAGLLPCTRPFAGLDEAGRRGGQARGRIRPFCGRDWVMAGHAIRSAMVALARRFNRLRPVLSCTECRPSFHRSTLAPCRPRRMGSAVNPPERGIDLSARSSPCVAAPDRARARPDRLGLSLISTLKLLSY